MLSGIGSGAVVVTFGVFEYSSALSGTASVGSSASSGVLTVVSSSPKEASLNMPLGGAVVVARSVLFRGGFSNDAVVSSAT